MKFSKKLVTTFLLFWMIGLIGAYTVAQLTLPTTPYTTDYHYFSTEKSEVVSPEDDEEDNFVEVLKQLDPSKLMSLFFKRLFKNE